MHSKTHQSTSIRLEFDYVFCGSLGVWKKTHSDQARYVVFIGDGDIVTNLNGKELQVLLGEKWYDIDPYITTDIHEMVEQVAVRHSSESGYSSSGK